MARPEGQSFLDKNASRPICSTNDDDGDNDEF